MTENQGRHGRWRDDDPTGEIGAVKDGLITFPRVAAAMIAILVLFTLAGLLDLRSDTRSLRGEAEELRSDVDSARAERDALIRQIREEFGGQPIVEAEPGEAGPLSGAMPTDEQVAEAIDDWCRDNDCAGGGPTQAQVTIALAQFCSQAGDPCRGPEGTEGTAPSPEALALAAATAAEQYCAARDECQGEPGADAPPPTNEQVLAALEVICAAEDDPCRSTIPGEKGEQGEPGRGIESVAFVPNGADSKCNMVITYTDGATQTIEVHQSFCKPPEEPLLPTATP